jgi:CubicO group peptidase (beta-lactamase class C family)
MNLEVMRCARAVARATSLALVLSASLAHATDRIPSDVRDKVTRLVDEGSCIGIVVGVVDSAGAEYFTRGALSKAGDRKVNENTLFEIGSITKVFTCIVMVDMARAGLVALDDPIGKYLPPSAKVPSRGGKEITLRNLATHRSSLPRLPDNMDPADPEDPYADYTGELLMQFLAGHALSRDIGSAYEYSNLGMGLLGYTLANRAGVSYEALVVDRICKPLAMNDTGIALSDDQRSRFAQGHVGDKPVKNWGIDALAGAGGLRSSTRDMVRFMAANIGFVDTPLSATLRETYGERTETGEPELYIAFGWHISTKHETTLIWHNGGTGGYRSFCGFDPARKVGVVVLTNSATDIDDIGRHILEPKFELAALRTAIDVPTAVLDDYVGYYELSPGLVFHVTREGAQLLAQLTGQDAYPIYAESETEFFFKVVDAQLTFVRDAAGRVDHVMLHQNGDHKARRLTEYKPPTHVEVRVDPAILAQYVGKYQLAPGALFDVILDDGQLKVQLSGQARFPVYPESETTFFYKVVEAQITFEKDESGKVTGLMLRQGGFEQRANKVE